MSVAHLRAFPPQFRLKDLTAITSPVMEFKVNPNQESAAQVAEAWFDRCNVYGGAKKLRFLSYRFDAYAGMSFPDADTAHLETCMMFFFWAFSFDDLSDEGSLQSKPDAVQVGVDISMKVLRYPEAARPDFSYAAMLHEYVTKLDYNHTVDDLFASIWRQFARAIESWMKSQVEQARNRSTDEIPSVEEFIVLRRRTIGGPIVEAMVEYSLDLQIPEHVWEHPVLQEMSKAMIDIMTWPNDLCSFNVRRSAPTHLLTLSNRVPCHPQKEQADGDFQNLVFCIMIERDTDLQNAVDILTDMLAQRVVDYMRYKSQLPSFGAEVDSELARYTKALEQYTQGTIVWYYQSPRYFRSQEVLGKAEIMVSVYERTAPADKPMPIGRIAEKSTSLEPLRPSVAAFAYAAVLFWFVLCTAYLVLFLPSTLRLMRQFRAAP
ncbi:hypothetical protein BN946_scf184836.g8 [Trametes cinnabarina]|uniref:Terpene synthase n=1 Tax=Pycnoporus cinnabarinus TaxID=5643 RepID=A0A060SCC7_PYCCI|nr:hypothetical protein BN946_scf184836.g8 [Trametes cinnabarina]